MKAKAFILSALLLVPATATAGAQVVTAAPTPAVVKVTEANLPVALTDEELDEVTGENPFVAIGVELVKRAAVPVIKQAAGKVVEYASKAALADWVTDAVTGKSILDRIRGK